MTLRHLTVFAKVCEKMSMTAAAQELYVSQPAVSQTIAELEDYYHVPLFHRQSNRLHLTGAGEKLQKLTEQLLFWNDQIESTMKGTRTGPPLKVGGCIAAGNRFLAPLAAAYEREVGKARLYLYVQSSEELERRVLGAELDAAFVSGPLSSKDILSVPLYQDELVFVCPAGSPLLQDAQPGEALPCVSREAIQDGRFLIRETGSGSMQAFGAAMHQHQLRYEIRGYFSGEEAILSAVEHGLGIGLVSRSCLSGRAGSSVRPFRVDGIALPFSMKVIYHRDKFIFPEFAEFLDFSRQYLSSLSAASSSNPAQP